MTSGQHGAGSRRAIIGLVGFGLLAALATGMVVRARGDGAQAPADTASTVRPVVSRVDAPSARWARVLGRLDLARAAAWEQGRPALLRLVYASGSDALAADRALLSRYRHRGLSLSGVHVRYLSVRRTGGGQGQVRLLTVDRLTVETVVGPDGAPVAVPRDRRSSHMVSLARSADGWRIASVAAR